MPVKRFLPLLELTILLGAVTAGLPGPAAAFLRLTTRSAAADRPPAAAGVPTARPAWGSPAGCPRLHDNASHRVKFAPFLRDKSSSYDHETLSSTKQCPINHSRLSAFVSNVRPMFGVRRHRHRA
eukprot:scaffold186508_cov28-Prasinocladus_malaysianus.AAC.1